MARPTPLADGGHTRRLPRVARIGGLTWCTRPLSIRSQGASQGPRNNRRDQPPPPTTWASPRWARLAAEEGRLTTPCHPGPHFGKRSRTSSFPVRRLHCPTPGFKLTNSGALWNLALCSARARPNPWGPRSHPGKVGSPVRPNRRPRIALTPRSTSPPKKVSGHLFPIATVDNRTGPGPWSRSRGVLTPGGSNSLEIRAGVKVGFRGRTNSPQPVAKARRLFHAVGRIWA